MQRDRGILDRGAGLGRCTAVCASDLPDRVIQAFDQEIEQGCQAVGLHPQRRPGAPFYTDQVRQSVPAWTYPSPLAVDGQGTYPTLDGFVQMAPQVKKGLKDSPTAAGNGGTFLADQCEDLGILPVEIDDTPGATLGAHLWCQRHGHQARCESIPYGSLHRGRGF